MCVCVCVCVLSRIQLFATPETRQALLSMEFPRQEYWTGLPFPPSGDLPKPGIEPVSPALAGGFFTNEPPGRQGIGYCSGILDLRKVCMAYIY